MTPADYSERVATVLLDHKLFQTHCSCGFDGLRKPIAESDPVNRNDAIGERLRAHVAAEIALLLDEAHRAGLRQGWDETRQYVDDSHPRCTEECDLCLGRDDVLEDLTYNPYATDREDATDCGATEDGE